MKRIFLLLIFFCIIIQTALAQADAGPDKTVSKKFDAQIGTPGKPEWCYSWEAEPEDPTLVDKHAPQPKVHPTQTTTYTLTVTGPDFSFKSKDVVTVYRLKIEYFRHSAAKEWKVVVGEPIQYSAIASADCKDWKWEMRDGDPYWHLQGGNGKSGTNMKLPYTDLEKAKNSWFGEENGTVTVSCVDAEGRTHEFQSTELNPGKKAKVFFNPDLNRQGGAPSETSPPCWFEFWKDGKVIQDIEICKYRHEPGLFGGWDLDIGMYLSIEAPTVNTGPRTLKDLNGKSFKLEGKGKHLQCVAEVLAHELHHRDIQFSQGGIGVVRPNHKDTDGIRDGEETSPSKTFFPASLPDNGDSFGLHYPPKGRFEYSDNEVRCRIIELYEPKATFPERDWSKDPENPQW